MYNVGYLFLFHKIVKSLLVYIEIMIKFSNEELFEIVMTDDECNRNDFQMGREFERRFPNSPKPNQMFIIRLNRYLKAAESIQPSPGPGRNRQYSDNEKKMIF